MVDQRDAKLIAVHAGRRLRLLDIRDETGRWLRPAGELPSQEIQKTAHLGSVGIEKAFPVKVLRKRRCAVSKRGTGGVFQQAPRVLRDLPAKSAVAYPFSARGTNYLPLPFGPCASSGIVMIQSFR